MQDNMPASIHINPVSPQQLTVNCLATKVVDPVTGQLVPGGILPDMTVVVSSVIKLLKPDGTVKALAVTISNKTSGSMTISHLFQQGDMDQVGNYKAYAVHSLPVGQVRGDTQTITVLDDFK